MSKDAVKTGDLSRNIERGKHRAVIADPHVVYYDAVRNSPWNQSDHSILPSKDDWSTYRYAVKDIILGVVTHRYNRQTRRLEIRAYFIGEHPIFRELEPTRQCVKSCVKKWAGHYLVDIDNLLNFKLRMTA